VDRRLADDAGTLADRCLVRARRVASDIVRGDVGRSVADRCLSLSAGTLPTTGSFTVWLLVGGTP
jgi:hypothetical protein